MNNNYQSSIIIDNKSNINNNNSRLIEFINQLKIALQNGNLEQNDKQISKQQQQQYEQSYHGSNVSNLSNQTFNYIINWLKQQSQLNEDLVNNGQMISTPQSLHSQQQHQHHQTLQQNGCLNTNNVDTTNDLNHYLSEIQLLKNQLKIYEEEKEYYCAKLKELQEENIQLKAKLNGHHHHHHSYEFNSQNDMNQLKTNHINNNFDEKEIEKLKQNLYELAKSNEEKDKRIDELAKQVSRFKRIQEIVLNSQNVKTRNLEIDFDNSDSNSIPSVNSDKESKDDKTKSTQKQNGNLVNLNLSHTSTSTTALATNKNGILASTRDLAQDTAQIKYSSTEQISITANSTASQQPKSLSVKNLTQAITTNVLNQDSKSIISDSATISTILTTNDNAKQHYNTLPSTNLNSMTQSLSLANYLFTSNSKQQPQSLSNSIVNQTTPTTATTTTTSSLTTTTTTAATTTTARFNKSNEVLLNSANDLNSGYVSDGPLSNYSINKSANRKFSADTLDKNKTLGHTKGLKSFFGRLMRTSSGNIRDISDATTFKRGGFRATAGPRLEANEKPKLNHNRNEINSLSDSSFAKWDTEKICKWFQEISFDMYIQECRNWVKNGLQLLQASIYDYEKHLGMKNPLHRKRLKLYLQTTCLPEKSSSGLKESLLIDYHWVTKWLDDIGLPQYKDYFQESRIDGLMLYYLTNEDLIYLNVHSELHHISIKHAINLLKMNTFNQNCLKRRPTYDEKGDKADVVSWTNHRVMEWLRSIDLSEYAPNLRGSGVHGSLMVFEPRFNSTVLADILSIPGSKTLLRRHLNTHFVELIGAENQLLKREAELKSTYVPLSASNKIKLVKRGIFSHKRTKSYDAQELLCPVETSQNYSYKTLQDRSQFKTKLSILAQENVPTSIV